jgi:uncharacterized protein (TIGR02646 family)
MIKVEPMPEYPRFNAEVRVPGAAFLARCPAPTNDEFRKHSYWSRATNELHAAYAGLCAYTARYMLREHSSVDHFRPKNLNPTLAYEWSNFRLSGPKINSRKGHGTDVLDPFEVQNDWFHLDIPSCLMKANPALDRQVRVRINITISTLGLNQDDSYVDERMTTLIDYAKGDLSFPYLQRRHPFLAKEIERQGLTVADLQVRFTL